MRVIVDSLGEIPTSVVSFETKRKIARCVLYLTLDSDEEDENLDQRALIRSISVCTASVKVEL